MASEREKTLSYRRAEWFTPSVLTLERAIREALGKLLNISDRTVAFGAHYVRVAKTKDIKGGGLLLHFTAEIPGDSTSIVPKASARASHLDLKKARPPADGEWLSGDAFLFVRDDHVCMCTTDIHDGNIRRFLQLIFEKAKIRKDATKFVLSKVADISKVKLLHSEGVRELEIRATLYKATANYHKRKNRVVGVAGAIGKHFKAFLGSPHDVTKNNLRVELTVKVDKRYGSKSLELSEKEIEALARDVVENYEADDEFVIVTKKNHKITAKEIFMRTKAWIQSDGKTVNYEKAWDELTAFYVQLHRAGALEE